MNNKLKLNIWNREFELPIIFQNYSNEKITAEQVETVNSLAEINFEESLVKTKEYIQKYYSSELDTKEILNIFRYVMPKSILITRESNHKLALMCNFRFDMEHGLAVIFENESYKAVGPQDIIL